MEFTAVFAGTYNLARVAIYGVVNYMCIKIEASGFVTSREDSLQLITCFLITFVLQHGVGEHIILCVTAVFLWRQEAGWGDCSHPVILHGSLPFTTATDTKRD